jgi:hypothetical protein
MDDPLFLLMQGIWLFAAGMYPLGMGFLFGVCSACCDECPDECSKCTHHYNTSGECNFLNDLTWSYTIAGIGTITVPNVPGEPCTGQGDNSLDIPLNDLPAPDAPASWSNAYFCSGDFDSLSTPDRCGCDACNYAISLVARFALEGEEEQLYRKLFLAQFGACEQTSAQMLSNGDWVADFPGYGGTFGEQVVAYLNSLTITMTLSDLQPCDCGACCDGECEDDVAEGGCENWAGVGTACDDDPDPCAEE